MSKVITMAQALSKQFEGDVRNDGTKFRKLKEDEHYQEWMRDVIFAGHLDRMPDDTMYRACENVLDEIANLDEDTDDSEILDSLELEPDCYTSDLTGWLNSDNRNVYYLDEAIANGASDGFQLLAMAQADFYRDVANAIIDKLVELAEDIDEDEEDDNAN
jgi:hypothetical protein